MLSQILTFIPLALAILAQGFIAGKGYLTDSALLYGIAVIMFVLLFRRSKPEPSKSQEERRIGLKDILTNRKVVFPGVCFLALFSISIGLWFNTRFLSPLSNLALFLFLASLVLVSFSIRELGKLEPCTRTENKTGVSLRVELVLLIAIILVGVFMRVYQLTEIPEGVWYDESDSALEALQTDAGAFFSPAAFRYRGNPSAYYYLVYLAFKTIGVNLFAVRFVTAAIGILAIPATFVLARMLFGRYVGLVAAFFMAVSRWHFDFSRFGMPNISAPLVEILMLYFLMRAIINRRWSDYAIAGLMLGLGLHTYTAFKIVVLIPIAIIFREIVFQRGYLRSSYQKLALFGIASIITFAPLGVFAIHSPDQFSQRLAEASVFAGKNTFEEQKAALESNIVKHFLMFNVRGDGNGRHNLPGEPMLDFHTSAFFVLGVGYSLYKLRRREYYMIVSSLGIGLLAGILSLDFEAPQGARTIVITPVISIIAAIPLGMVVGKVLERVFSLKIPGRIKAVPLVISGAVILWLLLLIGQSNYRTFFERQARDFSVWSSFSAPETLLAREANKLGPDYEYYIADYFVQHPTLRFLTPWLKNYEMVKASQIFPLRVEGDRPIAIFFDPQKEGIYELARQYYPNAVLKAFRHPYSGNPVLYSAIITPEDISRIQGVEARYFDNIVFEGAPVVSRKETSINANWQKSAPLALPFGVEWQGILNIPEYGRYLLGIEGQGQVQLYVDENLVIDESKREISLALAKGNHSLRIRHIAGEADSIVLYWQPPGKRREPIPKQYLYTKPVTNNGLLGSYYPNDKWSGTPSFEQIDSSIAATFHILPLPRPYTVLWKGKLYAPTQGIYSFRVDFVGDVSMMIDGKVIASAQAPATSVSGKAELNEGFHDIQINYLDKLGWSRIHLFWSIPSQTMELLPSRYLFPPQGKLTVPSTTPANILPSDKTQSPIQNTPVLSPTIPIKGQFVSLFGVRGDRDGELIEPRDIAVDSLGNIYIVDSGNWRIQRFTGEGKFIDSWGKQGDSPGEFQEPAGIVIDKDNSILVLDALNGWITRFDNNGKILSRFGGPSASFYRPRGISISKDGIILVADTGRNRIVKFDKEGRILDQFGTKGAGNGQLLEPIDILIDSRGYQVVVDMGNRRVQYLDPFGSYINEWEIPQADPLNGSHIALAPDDSLYITIPARNVVQQRSLDGKILAEWGGPGMLDEQFRLPTGIFLDSKNNLFVADTYNNRIQKFSLKRQ